MIAGVVPGASLSVSEGRVVRATRSPEWNGNVATPEAPCRAVARAVGIAGGPVAVAGRCIGAERGGLGALDGEGVALIR